MKKILIVGAGIGGLTTAVELAKSGLDVTVLEAHVDPGGCAATFFHKGYKFDAGATLAGGFAPGAPMDILSRRFDIDWQAKPTDIAMQVHLPDGSRINRWSDSARWQEERQLHFRKDAETFWRWQENTADRLWQFTQKMPSWPPQSIREACSLVRKGLKWLQTQPVSSYANLLQDTLQPTRSRLPVQNEKLRQFIDAQLLISAQTTSQHANALYSAAALDLARLGVVHLPGGIGSVAQKLVNGFRRYGGQIHYRQTVTQVRSIKNHIFEIQTKRGDTYLADTVIFNLPPWNIKTLLGEAAPNKIHHIQTQPKDGWGAFMVYAGIPDEIIPEGLPLHQQIIASEPLGEGNSVFLSLSPTWDAGRAPQGFRAATISTHTNFAPWWDYYAKDTKAYNARKTAYTAKVLKLCDHILPGFSANAAIVMPGTPVTFERFTHRIKGWVGGFPQTSLLRAWGPHLDTGLWMVGDSIFPGQSMPAVALGGLRVAQDVLAASQKSHYEIHIRTHKHHHAKTLS